MHTDVPFTGFLLFLGSGLAAVASGLLVLGALAVRRRTLALTVLGVGAVGIAGYAVLLVGASATSRDAVLARGAEKHICEMDCHVAYAVTGVRTARTLGEGAAAAQARGRFWVVTVRARFDETTTSPRRPVDVPVRPGPRLIEVLDARGHAYPRTAAAAALPPGPAACAWLRQPLLPGAGCDLTLVFDLPVGARATRLLIADAAPVALAVIGHEMSPWHRRTYFALEPDPAAR